MVANCYTTMSEPIDFAQYKAAKLQQIAIMRQYMATMEDAKEKKKYCQSIAGRLGKIGNFAAAGGDLATWKLYTQQAEAEFIAGGRDPKSFDSPRVQLLRYEAEVAFRQSGDLAASSALWDQSIAIEKSLAKDPATYKPRTNPYVLDDWFTTGVDSTRLRYIFRALTQYAEKKHSTLSLQRTEPDEIRVLVEKGYAKIDDDGNYIATAAGLAAFPPSGSARTGPPTVTGKTKIGRSQRRKRKR
jgi:hypothetical protein